MTAAPPRVLLLGGIDSSGGAGVTLDAAVVTALGGQPLPLPVALTVQSRRGFRSLHPIDAAIGRAMLDAAVADGGFAAVKLGLLGSVALITDVASALHEALTVVRSESGAPVPVVVDPVLSATAGGLATDDDVVAAYREHVLPLATLLTPNGPEFGRLFGGDPKLATEHVPAVLWKGGHATDIEGDGGSKDTAIDTLLRRDHPVERFVRSRLPVGPVRGTGCALASAIACHLAVGRDLPNACRLAGDTLAGWLRALGPAPADGLPRSLPVGVDP